MYEYLKTLMNAAEKIGSINEVSMDGKTTYCGDRIKISGVSGRGEAFELRLEVVEPADKEVAKCANRWN